MKRLSILLALGLVLIAGTSAFAAFDSQDVPVHANILQYVEVEYPEAITLGDIDFGQGFGERVARGLIRIKTNDDVGVRMSSDGFRDANGVENTTLNSLISYYYPGYSTGDANSFRAGGWKGPKTFAWDYGDVNGIIEFWLEAWFNKSNRNPVENVWHLIRSGEYTDIVTVTVEAAK